MDHLDPDALAEADLLVVLGGPIGVGQVELFPFLADELTALRQRIARDLPTLGLCLGAQLIAAALGAKVQPANAHEIGYGPIELTSSNSDVLSALDGTAVLHWHADTFDIPDDATRLAATRVCANQAFELGRTLALQFHIEADPQRIDQWLIGHIHELTALDVNIAAIRSDAATFGPELTRAGAATVRFWLRRVETSHPSRATAECPPVR